MPGSPDLQANRVFPPVFRVYEHELLRVGDQLEEHCFSERQLESLLALSERTGNRYFTIGHRSVRFKHFVGILVTSELRVEILPKLDRPQIRSAAKWQGVLIEMLRSCQWVRPESIGTTGLDARSGDLLEWYIRIFVAELKILLRHGLLHAYTSREENSGVWKGRLQLHQQLKHNYLHKERFFVQYDQFNHQHPVNLFIGAAIRRLHRLPLVPDLRAELTYLARLFPQAEKNTDLFSTMGMRLLADRRLDRYAPCLQIAQHILQHQLPDIRAGEQYGLALLFDMNLLFEEYLYRQLLRWKPPGFHIERQQSRVFWGQNRLRPDLVLSYGARRWVLDTKWRLLSTQQPTADELRQIYVYCDYFKADCGVLIFPQTEATHLSQIRNFAPLPGTQDQNRRCQIYFAAVLNEAGVLNQELGKELYISNPEFLGTC